MPGASVPAAWWLALGLLSSAARVEDPAAAAGLVASHCACCTACTDTGPLSAPAAAAAAGAAAAAAAAITGVLRCSCCRSSCTLACEGGSTRRFRKEAAAAGGRGGGMGAGAGRDPGCSMPAAGAVLGCSCPSTSSSCDSSAATRSAAARSASAAAAVFMGRRNVAAARLPRGGALAGAALLKALAPRGWQASRLPCCCSRPLGGSWPFSWRSATAASPPAAGCQAQAAAGCSSSLVISSASSSQAPGGGSPSLLSSAQFMAAWRRGQRARRAEAWPCSWCTSPRVCRDELPAAAARILSDLRAAHAGGLPPDPSPP